jgi:hypothetical protein
MLDRSEAPNLFAQDAPAEHRPALAASPVADVRPRRAPRRQSPARGPLARSRIRAPRAAALARLGQLRTYRRYAPVAVLLLLLLTHPAGCGRSVPPTAVTSGPSATPAEGAATVIRAPTVSTPPPLRRRAAALRARAHSRRRVPAHARAPGGVLGFRLARAQPSAPVAAPSLSYQLTVSQRPRPSGGGHGEEFGFER